MIVLAVDPGSHKTGLAVVDEMGSVLHASIEPTERVERAARELLDGYGVTTIAMGRGTNAGPLAERLAALDRPIQLVDERETTLRARSLYFQDHPPTGWRRLVPLGMQLPPRPIDDYAAILIGRRFLAEVAAPKPS